MDRCALFVDAGYVLADGAMAVHGTRHRESVAWDYAGLLQLLCDLARERTGLPLLRCYWYEAAVEGRRTPEHDALADLPGLKLRLGRMRPGRREGVDTEVHRDLSTLARNHAISDAVIVSAEEDLAHVVGDIQDLGVRVTLFHITVDGNWTVSRLLRQECDAIVEISGVHLRPHVNLIAGAQPAQYHDQYSPGQFASAPLTNGHGASAGHGTYQALPPGHHQSPPAIYTSPATAPEQEQAARPQEASAPPPGAGLVAGCGGPPGDQAAAAKPADPDQPAVNHRQQGDLAAPPPQGAQAPQPPQPPLYAAPTPMLAAQGAPAPTPAPQNAAPAPPPQGAPAAPAPTMAGSILPAPTLASGASGASGSSASAQASPPAAPDTVPAPDHPQGQPGRTPFVPTASALQSRPASPARSGPPSQPPAIAAAQTADAGHPGMLPVPYVPSQQGHYNGPQASAAPVPATTTLSDAVQAAHAEGLDFGDSVARDAPALWLEAVLARKPRMPSDLEARLLQGSSLPIDFLLHDEVRSALRRGFWDALERSRR
ncbi:MAG: NYN domain-containing protein [Micromonosporaceae bacterium]